MAADYTTLTVAILGVAGTLLSPLLVQRVADRAKRQDFDLQSRRRREDREVSQRQAALLERRSIYAALNTASRRYQQAIEDYLRMLPSGAALGEARKDLLEARSSFRELYSDAQMTLPDQVLDAAIAVSAVLGEAYGMLKRLETGQTRDESVLGPPESAELIRRYCKTNVYNQILQLRQAMRTDLGVSPQA